MGWKTIQKHYKIEHLVHVVDGNICIGSHLCHDLIVLDVTGKLVSEAIGSWRDKRFPWIDQIKQDCESGKFKELAEAPDQFGELIDVFTQRDSQIITKQCEKDAFGYPNCCTDGELMYDNAFFKTRAGAEESLAYDSMSWLVHTIERLDEQAEDIAQLSKRLQQTLKGLVNSNCFDEKIKEGLAWRTEQLSLREQNRARREYERLCKPGKDKELMESQTERPRVVCLCGSTRFMEAFQNANLEETLAGRIVLSIGCNTKSDADLSAAGELTEEVKTKLDELHKRKIDLADEILVLNVGGYVGASTQSEIEYAAKSEKRIRWLEPRSVEGAQ